MATCGNCFSDVQDNPCPFCGYDLQSAQEKYPLALKPGTILNGRYIVGRVLGQGGFGITYIAQDYQTRKKVALKEYFPTDFGGRATDSLTVQIYSADRRDNFEYGKAQFLEEAKTLAAFIGNEHIVRIYSYFEENKTAYFVMEYVDGEPLNQYMVTHGGKLTPEEVNRLLLPLMNALDAVHAKGIVHRDIAPDNIIVTEDGSAKLIDFGAARYSTGEKSKSLDVILKHGFAPREQYTRRGRQGPWTDVYALAATWYYAVTGMVPPDAIDRIDDDGLVLPSSIGVKLNDKTEEVLLKALEVNALDRYQSMAEFRRAMVAAFDTVGEPPYREQKTQEVSLRQDHEELVSFSREMTKNQVQVRSASKASKTAEKAPSRSKKGLIIAACVLILFVAIVVIFLKITTGTMPNSGSKVPDLMGVWKGEFDLGPVMINEIDRNMAESDTGVEQLPSFGDYMDSLPCQIRMELKNDGTYLQTVEEASLASMQENMFASTVDYYYEFFRVVLVAQLAELGIEGDMSTREGLEAVLGMSMDDAIEMAIGSDMETYVYSLMDGLWEDMADEFKQEGQYKVEEGKLFLSDSPEHEVDSKIYHPFTYENGVLTLEKAVGADTEEEYVGLYPLVLRAA